METRRVWVIFAFKVVLIFLILATAYYIAILRPMSALPQAQLEAKKILARQESILLQNRLAIIQLSKVNPLSARYFLSMERIYEIIETTKTQGEEAIKAKLPEALNLKLSEAYPQMQSEYGEILKAQYEFIQRQKELDEKLGPIFEYFPKRDLLDTDRETKLARIKAATSGLEKIKTALPETAEIIGQTQEILEDGDVETISLQFRKLKTELFKIKAREVESQEELELLARQTNLLNKYRYFIDQITTLQGPLPQ